MVLNTSTLEVGTFNNMAAYFFNSNLTLGALIPTEHTPKSLHKIVPSKRKKGTKVLSVVTSHRVWNICRS